MSFLLPALVYLLCVYLNLVLVQETNSEAETITLQTVVWQWASILSGPIFLSYIILRVWLELKDIRLLVRKRRAGNDD